MKEKLPKNKTKQTRSKTPLSCDIFLYITQIYTADCTIQKNSQKQTQIPHISLQYIQLAIL